VTHKLGMIRGVLVCSCGANFGTDKAKAKRHPRVAAYDEAVERRAREDEERQMLARRRMAVLIPGAMDARELAEWWRMGESTAAGWLIEWKNLAGLVACQRRKALRSLWSLTDRGRAFVEGRS
jgi:hypothetical protein